MKADPAEATAQELASWNAEDSAHWEESARHIIDSGDVLDLFARSWQKLVAGEEKNAKLLYLTATSRLFNRCMSAALKGPSSAGKSQIRKQVLEYFPPEDVVSFTTLSEKALLYYEADFSHKILSMGEAAGAEEQSLQDYLLRELISEGRLRYPVVQKIEKVGLVTVTVEKNGPVAFMVTTTKAALHPENETRMLSLEVDDSEKQTENVLSKVAAVIGMNADKAEVHYFEPWRDFQRWLGAGNRNVVVPFAAELASLIPARSVRLRRDFTQVLLAIKAHALLHRYHRQEDGKGQIVADLHLDYPPVAKLIGGIVAEASGTSIEKEIQETINAVASVTATLAPDEGATADKVAKILRLDKSSAWRRLNKTVFKGYIVNLETRRGQPGRYRVTSQEIEAEELLPSLEALERAMQPAQPRNPTPKLKVDQGANRLHERLRGPCNPIEADTDCNPHATGHATGQDFESKQELATGCTVAPVASDEETEFEERAACLEYDGGFSREEAEARAAEELDIDLTLPAFLDRRRHA
jgi:hypothetical protein